MRDFLNKKQLIKATQMANEEQAKLMNKPMKKILKGTTYTSGGSLEEILKEFREEFSVMLERADREGQSATDWEIKLENFISKAIKSTQDACYEVIGEEKERIKCDCVSHNCFHKWLNAEIFGRNKAIKQAKENIKKI